VIHQDYAIDIPRDRIIWHYAKYALERRTVQVFLDVCFPRADIPRHLLKFIVSNVCDKMNTNPYLSLEKIETSENGDLAISEEFPFNMKIAMNAEERKN
jgi:hypothetical protein